MVVEVVVASRQKSSAGCPRLSFSICSVQKESLSLQRCFKRDTVVTTGTGYNFFYRPDALVSMPFCHPTKSVKALKKLKAMEFQPLHLLPSWLTNWQQQQQQQLFYGPLSGTTRVSWRQKKHSRTHHPDHHPTFISFFHLPRSTASSLFKLHAWQSFCTTSFHVLFGLPLGLQPSTSYSIHFFTQSVSSFRSTCPYHRSLFCCSISIISSIPSLSLNSLLGTLPFTLKMICNDFLVVKVNCWSYVFNIMNKMWILRNIKR